MTSVPKGLKLVTVSLHALSSSTGSSASQRGDMRRGGASATNGGTSGSDTSTTGATVLLEPARHGGSTRSSGGATMATTTRRAAPESSPGRRPNAFVYVLTCFSAIGGLLFGYDTGVVSGALLVIAADFNLTDTQQEAVVAATVAGAVLGSALGGRAANAFGRRPVIVCSSIVFVGGAIVMALALNFWVLVVGRTTVGVAIGLASMAVPMYIAEASPAQYRGMLVTVNNLFITGGQFASALVDGAFAESKDGWRWMLGLSGVPAAVMFVGFLFLPESPRWLIGAGRLREAAVVMQRTGQADDAAGGGDDGEGDKRDGSGGYVTVSDTNNTSESERSALLAGGRGDATVAVVPSDSEAAAHAPDRRDPDATLAGLDSEAVLTPRQQARVDAQLGEFGPSMRSAIAKVIASLDEDDTDGDGGGAVAEAPSQKEKQGLLHVLGDPVLRRALALGCGFQALQQLAGINTVMYYSGTILTLAGVHDRTTAIWLVAAVAFSNFAFTVVGLVLVERIGRRKLSLGSLAGVVLSLALLAGAFYVGERSSPATHVVSSGGTCGRLDNCFLCVSDPACGFCAGDGTPTGADPASCMAGNATGPSVATPSFDSAALVPSYLSGGAVCPPRNGTTTWSFDSCPGASSTAWLAVTALVLYLAFFAPGMGPMPWTVNSEIYPQNVRATCIGAATATNWVFNFLVSATFISLARAATPKGAFLIYTAIALSGFAMLYKYMPETKGRSLEQMYAVFAGSVR